jgi:oleandomycin transport system permease protein
VTVAVVQARCRFLRDSAIIAGRQLRVLGRSPGRLVYPLVQPLLLVVLFVSVFGNLALGTAGGGSYRQFIIPGILIQNVALTAPVTGLALLRDSGSGLADRFRSLPMAQGAVLAGRLASDALIFAAQALLVLGAGTLLGFRIRTGLVGVAGVVAVAVISGLALAVTCSWLALLIGDAETAERVLFFPFVAVVFTSSAFAPVSLLAGWLQPVARLSPVTAAAGLARSLAGGGPVAAPLTSLACWVAALAVLPGVLAIRRWRSAG